MSLCQSCKKKETCVELCSKARRVVEKDFVKPRELNIGQPEYFSKPFPDFVKRNLRLRKIDKRQLFSRFYVLPRRIQIVTLLRLGFERPHICQMLEIKRDTLRKLIWKYKNLG